MAPRHINLPQPWTLALPMESQRKSLLNNPLILCAFTPSKIKIRSNLELRKRSLLMLRGKVLENVAAAICQWWS